MKDDNVRSGRQGRRHQGRQGRHLALDKYPYGFASRFEGKPGTNPEELIGAAHAGCFTMALSLILGEAQLMAEHMETKAEVTLDKVADGFAITAAHLTLPPRSRAQTRRGSKSSPPKPRRGAPYPNS